MHMIAIMLQSMFEHLSSLADHEECLLAGDTLFRIGDPITSLFLVSDGTMRLVRHQPHGLELTLQRATQGSILAEASVFSDRYHCDAIAVSAATLHRIPRETLSDAFAGNLDLARSWAHHLAHEVQKARSLAEILSLKTVHERVDAWLLLKNESLPQKGAWRAFATEIGVSPEALYRELAKRRH